MARPDDYDDYDPQGEGGCIAFAFVLLVFFIGGLVYIGVSWLRGE